MLENIDLHRKTAKADYKQAKAELDLKLAALQRDLKALGIPVIIVFEGWSAAGKGTLINELILPLDPRGFNVHSTQAPTDEESLRPFVWRFWTRTPTSGRIAIFDRSWNRQIIADRVERAVKGKQLLQAVEDVRSFERQLTVEGTVIIKFFLHISKKEQKRRFDALLNNPATAFRVNEHDLHQHRDYAQHLAAAESMLAETDADYAPWTVVEAHDRRFAALKVFTTVVQTLSRRVDLVRNKRVKPEKSPRAAKPDAFQASTLDGVDLSLSLSRKEYEERIKMAQTELRDLEYQVYSRRIPVVIAFEGWDAAGKGGSIRRLTCNLDPRGYEVIPVAAPNDIEKAHHYLWRFWMHMPRAGHIAIFDRTWYGRVLVERVEGFCTEPQWRRAYGEINEMERHLAHFGTIILKFWLHIDPREQLRRFRQREKLEHKKWKITEEDWRNRKKLSQHRTAVEEMLYRTSTPLAPWTVVESNCKLYARVKVLETVCNAIRRRLK